MDTLKGTLKFKAREPEASLTDVGAFCYQYFQHFREVFAHKVSHSGSVHFL